MKLLMSIDLIHEKKVAWAELEYFARASRKLKSHLSARKKRIEIIGI